MNPFQRGAIAVLLSSGLLAGCSGDRVEALEAQVAELTHENETLKARLDELDTDLDQIVRETNQLGEDIGDVSHEVRFINVFDLSIETYAAERAVDSLEAQFDRLKESIETAQVTMFEHRP